LLTRPAPAARSRKGDNDDAPQNTISSDAPFGADLNQQYIQTNQELIQRKAELTERSKIWKPKHPRLIAIKDDMARLQRLLDAIKDQTKESSQLRAAAIKARLRGHDANIQNWEQKVMEASRKDSEYQRLQGAVTRTQGLIDKDNATLASLQAATNVSQEMLSVLQKASSPAEVLAGTVIDLLTGVIVGLIGGILILVLVDRAHDRFNSSTEVIERFSEPILGQIPNVSASRTDAGLPLLQVEDERYTFAESFRSLRSSLVFMPNPGELKTLLVTSSIPGEGKSTIASNLAITMALAGARVLLVDADLRRGDISNLFGIDGRFGLSSVLRGEVSWKSALQATRLPTLSVLPRGPVTNQSGELLLVPLVETLLAETKAAYDLVIFNSSPILATDDSGTLAPNFDGTLMVIRAQFTSARLVQNSLNAMYQRQVNVLGLILNCLDTDMPDYHYYRYPKYYAA